MGDRRFVVMGILATLLAACGNIPQPAESAGIGDGANQLVNMNWSDIAGGNIAKLGSALQIQTEGTTEVTYRVNGICSNLNGEVALDADSGLNTKAQFMIFKNDDAKPIYSSLTTLGKADAAQQIKNLDISNSKELRFRIDATGKNVRANWSNIQLQCNTKVVEQTPLHSLADVLTRVSGRVKSPDNFADLSAWQVGPSISAVASTVTVPTTEDTDGTLDQLKSTSGYQWFRTDVIANPGETLEVSLMLSGTTGSSLQLNLRSTTAAQLAGSGAAYVPVTPTPKRVVVGRFTKANDGTNVVRFILAGITPSDTIYAGGIRVDLVTAGAVPPAAPTGFVAQPSTSNITLSWLPVVGATSYQLERTASGDTLPTQLVTTVATAYTDTSAVAGVNYTYGVRAVNANGPSATTTTGPVALGGIVPPPPTGRMVSPDNLRDPSWSGGAALTPSISTVVVPTTEDSDGTLDLLKSTTGYQWWQSNFNAYPGETLEVSMMVAGTTGSSMQMNIRNLSGSVLAGSGTTYIPMNPTPRRVVVGRFTKANDGTTQVRLLLAGITPSDTIYAGGVRIAVIGPNPTPDTTAPTVSLATSSANITAAGSVTLTATATDNIGVSKVEFFEGSTLLGTDTTAPYELVLPAYAFANNGTHTYTAKATDAANNVGASLAVNVVVNIPAPDTTAPTVGLATSSPSLTVQGSITLTATATDNVGVSKVEFIEGATVLNTVTTAPFVTNVFYPYGATYGTHSYIAKAYDAAGNVATSTAVTVDVKPAPPKTIGATFSAQLNQVNVNWSYTGLSSTVFILERSINGGAFTQVASGTLLTSLFTDYVLTSGTYTYRVHAVNGTFASVSIVSTPVDATAPTVSLATSNANVTSAQTITLTPTASDYIGLSKVEYYDGATLIDTITTQPYIKTIALTAANNGTHSYTVKAFDLGGNSVASAAVSVNVNIVTDTTPPVVNVNATSVTPTGSFIDVLVTASDDVALQSVELFADGVSVGPVTSGTALHFAYTKTSNGTHTYTAKATDTSGNVTTSAPATAITNIPATDTVPPTIISFTVDQTNVTTDSLITMRAIWTDNVAAKNVQFFDGTTSLGTLPPPGPGVSGYSQQLSIGLQQQMTAAKNGVHSYTAKVFDNTGNFTISAPIVVTVNIPDIVAPTVSLATSSANVMASGNLDLTATATDNVGVTQVEFFDGANSLGVLTSAPYKISVPLAIANNGTHSYTAKATDAAGNSKTSAVVSVTVNIPDTTAPTITSFTSSSNNVTTPSSITLTTTATDDVGVTKVEFFDGTTSLGVVGLPVAAAARISTLAVAVPVGQQFSLTVPLTSANNGTHNYSAKAYDAAGNIGNNGAPVSVVVNIPTARVILESNTTNVAGPTDVTLTASATNPADQIVYVVFYNNGVQVGSSEGGWTYTYLPTFLNNGTHTYTADVYLQNETNPVTTNAITVNINISAVTLAVPTNLVVQDWGSSDGTLVSWDIPVGATGYQIERRINGGLYEQLNFSGSALTGPISYHDLVSNQPTTFTFQYRVRVYSANGLSDWLESEVITRMVP